MQHRSAIEHLSDERMRFVELEFQMRIVGRIVGVKPTQYPTDTIVSLIPYIHPPPY